MKLFNKILLGAAAISVMGAFSSCKEEATLSGADAVYIEMANTNVSLLVGDTLKLEAKVSNVAGKEINTPITWTVDDNKVVELVDIVEWKKVPNPNYQAPVKDDTTKPGSPEEGENPGEGEGENPGEGEGEGGENVASRADDGGEPTEPGTPEPPVNTTDRYISVDYHYVGITPVAGAQGKTTTIRATLENGQFAITSVSVGRNKLAGSITPALEETVSYNDYKNDVVWFNVDPIAVIDDYDISFKIDMIEVLTPEDRLIPGEDTFIYPDPDFTLGVEREDPESGETVEVRLPVKDGIVIDREGKRVGVVFTAPRLAGKSKVTLSIGAGDENASASTILYLFPRISGGLMYEKNGEIIYPNFSDKNPSNEKPRMSTATMDVNSSHYVACCMGINTGREDDIENARLAEDAGYFTWELSGSSVVVEESFTSTEKLTGEKYVSGYISYLKVRSGSRQGTARATYTFPGQSVDTDDEDNVFVTDITVMNFNEAYPVDYIVVKTEDGIDIPDNGHIDAYIGRTLNLSVSVEPDASFTYHIPEITSSDPSILEVVERGATDGLSRRFETHRTGDVVLTFKSLDVTKEVHVTVSDRVHSIAWGVAPNANLPLGVTEEAKLNVMMASDVVNPAPSYNGEITWTSSNPAVVSVTPKANAIYADITAHAEGKATITATLDCGFTISQEVTVITLSAVEITSDFYGEGYLDDPWFKIYAESPDGDVYEFGATMADFAPGTYTGADGFILSETDGYEYDDAEYNLTITDNGDGTYTVSGTVTHSSGAKFNINGLTFEVV